MKDSSQIVRKIGEGGKFVVCSIAGGMFSKDTVVKIPKDQPLCLSIEKQEVLEHLNGIEGIPFFSAFIQFIIKVRYFRGWFLRGFMATR